MGMAAILVTDHEKFEKEKKKHNTNFTPASYYKSMERLVIDQQAIKIANQHKFCRLKSQYPFQATLLTNMVWIT